MTAFTNHAENLLMEWLFRASAQTRPTAWHVALHTADPGETGATAELAAANGYARQSVSFTAASGGVVDNTALLTFGPCTGSNWGTVTHISIWDASSGGNCLMYGALSSSATINVGDSLTIAANALDLTAA